MRQLAVHFGAFGLYLLSLSIYLIFYAKYYLFHGSFKSMNLAGDVSSGLSFLSQLCLSAIFWNLGTRADAAENRVTTEFATIEVEDVDDEEAELMARIWNQF